MGQNETSQQALDEIVAHHQVSLFLFLKRNFIFFDFILTRKQMELEKKAKKSNLNCTACKKSFKSLAQWDNHVTSNKHKTAVKNLKGPARAQYDSCQEKIEEFRGNSFRKNGPQCLIEKLAQEKAQNKKTESTSSSSSSE